MQLYCTSDLRKYKRGKYEYWNRHIKTENGTKLKNVFDLHRVFLEAIHYGQKITNKRFLINYYLETNKFKKGIQSENGESKEQAALEER